MPLKNYGVLKETPINRVLGSGSNPHYQIHVVDDTTDYRTGRECRVGDSAPRRSSTWSIRTSTTPSCWNLRRWTAAGTASTSQPAGPALDFIRSNLFDPRTMVPLPFNVPGPDNDLNEKIDHYIQRAMADEDALIYAFGEPGARSPARRTRSSGSCRKRGP